MQSVNSPATHTELISLPHLLKKIEDGDIRVPAFQREFVWNRTRIRELLSSIYNGYPIGSILLLRTSDRLLTANLNSTLFPSKRVQYPTNFILDGMQRLTTLYGVLISSQKAKNRSSYFNVVFDLKTGTFKHVTKKVTQPWLIHLSGLFSNQDNYFEIEDALFEFGDREARQHFASLFRIFQLFEIPIITIEERSLHEVVDIFLKINNQGIKLTETERTNALEWLVRNE